MCAFAVSSIWQKEPPPVRHGGHGAARDGLDEGAPDHPVVGADHVAGVDADGIEAIGHRLQHDVLGRLLGAAIVDRQLVGVGRRGLVDGHAVVKAPGRARRGVDEAPDVPGLRRLDHGARARHVGVGLGLVAGGIEAHVAGHVEHGIHAFGNRALEKRPVPDVAHHQTWPGTGSGR